MSTTDHVRQVLAAAERAKQPRVIHRTKPFGGLMTPDEVEARWGAPRGARCGACGRPPCTSARVFMPVDEVHRSIGAELLGRLIYTNPKGFESLCIQVDGLTYVRVSWTFACREHLPLLERTAAKSPSWCIVDIDRGPAVSARNPVTVGPSVFDAEPQAHDR